MKISITWLKELLPSLKANAAAVDKIEKKLNAVGFEVEAKEDIAERFANVVVGEVKSLRPHPDADKLRVAEVYDGEGTRTVVCGAPNVAEGQKIAFAKIGAHLPNGMHIERRAVRGQESEGMICSGRELGLSEDGDGILVLEPKAKPGKALAKQLELEDTVLEVAVTPNRPDALSHLGIARELAAIHRLKLPQPNPRVSESKVSASAIAKVEIEDDARCPKYVARVITGVKIGPSPAWVQNRLRAVGQRPISNVVDVTNLVLLELGHPLHAFDLDKLKGPKIVVRTAKPGEKMTTIDGVVRALDPDDLMICDAELPVAMAGVMGGADTAVSETTTNLLLESALFEPKTIRRSSKRHALHTEASHRFERGADPGMLEAAIDRCAELIQAFAGGHIAKGRVVAAKKLPKPAVVGIRAARAELVLGREVDKKEVKSALTALGLRPSSKKPPKSKLKDAQYFEIPSWRVDLSREEDLIEEVARLGGYDQIPTVMPPGSPEIWTQAPAVDHERKLREVLAGEGFKEAVSLAFNSRAQVEAFGIELSGAVEIANPLGEESALMRMSMLPALLRAARLNQDVLPSITDLRLFEIGKTFRWANPPDKLPVESHRVALALRGHRLPPSWSTKDASGAVPNLDAYDLKSAVESILGAFHVSDVAWIAHEASWLHPRSGTRIERAGKVLGVFGELHPDVMPKFGLEGPPLFVADLSVDAIVEASAGHAKFRPLPKHPPARRDLSFFIAREVPAARVLETIRASAGAANLESVDLFDVYEGKGLPEGKRSLAVAMLFRAEDRTLTDQEVETAQAAIIGALTGALGAEIRSA